MSCGFSRRGQKRSSWSDASGMTQASVTHQRHVRRAMTAKMERPGARASSGLKEVAMRMLLEVRMPHAQFKHTDLTFSLIEAKTAAEAHILHSVAATP